MSILSFSLEGKLALITGARRGIGRGIALAFAEAGADVAICDIVVEGGEMEAVTGEIRKLGRRSLAVQTDVTKEEQVNNLVKRVENELGTIDILVNNVGGGGGARNAATPVEMSPEDWMRVFDINFKGCLLCSLAVIKGMIKQNSGNIISISSGAALKGSSSPYGIAKAAILRFTGGLSMDLARYNIRVNAICPTWLRSEMTRRMWANPEILKHFADRIPLGDRLAEVDDIIGLALYFASDASSFVTGQWMAVDGGRWAAGDYYLGVGTSRQMRQ